MSITVKISLLVAASILSFGWASGWYHVPPISSRCLTLAEYRAALPNAPKLNCVIIELKGKQS
jgi:hypothetical protein